MTIQDPNIGGIDANNDDNDDDGCHRGRWQKARRGLRASLAGKGGEARWCTANWTIITMMMILWGLKKGVKMAKNCLKRTEKHDQIQRGFWQKTVAILSQFSQHQHKPGDTQ